ncbi:hypothetical protein IE81DRAFT_35031 [Ceraceosorus guamensis]|uniref:STI1/HOP DP domain-containing protein n=1 Tax=Ceraceosorus guamensis TaxID=1522189 RepID=A0A316VQE6_9BASI|nr:hypothetical protein IE81DRAFT_35031 [Ceraceosorus guamensis]PWN39288.1 hypothetical protein IE81DRAFT_35031 [Ceraceosorus guamensis]
MFRDAKLFEKLEANESTKRMLADPSFVSKLKELQSGRGSPQDAFSDSRMVEVMGVLMGIDLKAFQRPEGSNEGPEELQRRRDREEAEQEAQRENEKRRATKAAQDKKIAEEEAAAAAAAAAAPIDSEEAKAKKAADEAKARGSALYLKRQFVDAIAEFKQAWELHKDVSYLTNLAACQYEKASYDEAIATCQEAIEASREYKTDYKLIAKAYTRIGNSYLKKEDLQNAIKFFEKSLTEHRTADTLAKLQSTEKLLKEKEKQAYIDPSKAEEERARGNELFKKGDFAGSVAAYVSWRWRGRLSFSLSDSHPASTPCTADPHISLWRSPFSDRIDQAKPLGFARVHQQSLFLPSLDGLSGSSQGRRQRAISRAQLRQGAPAQSVGSTGHEAVQQGARRGFQSIRV